MALGQVAGQADHVIAAGDDLGIMGGQHERAAIRCDAEEPGQDELAGHRVLLGGRLVGDEQLRARGQGPRHRDTLLLTAGQFLDQVIPEVTEP